MLALLFLVRLRVGGALWRLGVALRLIEFMLTLLLLVGLGVARIFRGTLRCVRLIACAGERGPLVTLAGALRALLAVERELFLADVRLHAAHAVARAVQTVIDEELAVAIVLGDSEPV